MRMDSLLALLLIGLLSAVGQPALAAPVTIYFSFHDETYDIDVEGYILGLQDNGDGQAATSVVVTSNSGGYGVGEYAGNLANYWWVTDGNVTYAEFISSGMLNTPPDVTCCSLGIGEFWGTGGVYTIGELRNDPSGPGFQGVRNIVTFTLRNPASPVPVMPLPPLVLLALVLVAIGIRWRQRRLK